jgi:hypothetical protein
LILPPPTPPNDAYFKLFDKIGNFDLSIPRLWFGAIYGRTLKRQRYLCNVDLKTAV